MRMLVTGAAGFIGSQFVRTVFSESPSDNVTVLDALTYAGNPENLKELEKNPRYRFVEGSIGDAALIEKFDRPGMQPACARPLDILVHALLDDRNVGAAQRQLAGEHQPGRTAADNDHIMLECLHVPPRESLRGVPFTGQWGA